MQPCGKPGMIRHEKAIPQINASFSRQSAEYDHPEGVLFVDRIKALKRQLLRSKLANISKGDVEVAYKMLFPLMKKKR